MKGIKAFFTIGFLLAFIFCCDAFAISAEICNRVVAIVNSDVITLHELNNKIKEMTGVDADTLRMQDEKKYLEARRNILDLLIDERIAQEKIRELGIEVTAREIDETVERIKKNNYWTQEDLMAGLKERGVDYEDYRDGIKKQMERMRLLDFEVKSRIIVREEKLKEYYEENKEKFQSEEEVHLAIILLRAGGSISRSEAESLQMKAEQIVRRVNDGEDFAKLAEKYSEGPGKEDGGDVGFYKVSQLDPALRSIIDNMSDGEVSKPIISPNGIQIVKLLEKHEAKVKSFDEVRDSIFEIFYREEVNERYSSWIKTLREKAYTKIIF